jgi:hypothetical protein
MVLFALLTLQLACSDDGSAGDDAMDDMSADDSSTDDTTDDSSTDDSSTDDTTDDSSTDDSSTDDTTDDSSTDDSSTDDTTDDNSTDDSGTDDTTDDNSTDDSSVDDASMDDMADDDSSDDTSADDESLNADGVHCSEGLYLDAPYPYPLSNCPDYDPAAGGGLIEGGATFRNIALLEPVNPGDTFAFSAEMDTTTGARMELWGATEECGPGLELIATAEMGQELRCMAGVAEGGPYTHMIWVWNGGGSHLGVTMCVQGSCQAQ